MPSYDPNASILRMFDPLQQSPQKSSYDKENSTPDDSIFTLLLKPPPCSNPPPVLKKRLIDVGDITIEDAFLFINGDDDDDIPVTPSGRSKLNHVPFHANTPPRQPLSDLAQSSSRTPRPSPLSAITLPTVQITTPEKNSHILPPLDSSELITDVTQPWRNSTIEEDLTTSFAELYLAQSTIAPLPRRPLAVPKVAHDPRRDSVDLQSSFFMQANNVESSFDLLKDEIMIQGTDASFGAESEDESGPSDRLKQAPPLKRTSSISSKVSAVLATARAKRSSPEKASVERTPMPKMKPMSPAVAKLTGSVRSHTKSSSLAITLLDRKTREAPPTASASRLAASTRRATVSTQESPLPTKPASSSASTLKRVPSLGIKSSRLSLSTAPKTEPPKAATVRIPASKTVGDATSKLSASTMSKLQARASLATLRRAPSAIGTNTSVPTAVPAPPTKTGAPRPRSSTIAPRTSILKQRSS